LAIFGLLALANATGPVYRRPPQTYADPGYEQPAVKTYGKIAAPELLAPLKAYADPGYEQPANHQDELSTNFGRKSRERKMLPPPIMRRDPQPTPFRVKPDIQQQVLDSRYNRRDPVVTNRAKPTTGSPVHLPFIDSDFEDNNDYARFSRPRNYQTS